MMIGKHTTEAQKIKNTDIATVRDPFIFHFWSRIQELSLPPVKLHCSVLAEDAIKAAVRDIANKKKAAAEASA